MGSVFVVLCTIFITICIFFSIRILCDAYKVSVRSLWNVLVGHIKLCPGCTLEIISTQENPFTEVSENTFVVEDRKGCWIKGYWECEGVDEVQYKTIQQLVGGTNTKVVYHKRRDDV